VHEHSGADPQADQIAPRVILSEAKDLLTLARLSLSAPSATLLAMPLVDGVSAAPDLSFRGIQRQLASLVPALRSGGDRELLLEASTSMEPPRLIDTELIEPGPMRAHRVFGEPEIRFAAFLDGTQASRVLYYARGIPIIHGTVAAVVRERRNRRLTTWKRPIVRRRLYAPRKSLSDEWNGALDALTLDVVDTSTGPTGDPLGDAHPYAFRDAAIHRVQKDRELAERELAESWCALQREPLLIDGGTSGSEKVAVSECTVGVVKSHRTLYAAGEGLQTVLRLGLRERSSVFRVTSPKRSAVASWYLRLRDPAGQDPMWGLVRVEVAQPERIGERRVGERADAVSRWILAEVSPLSLPDARWDKMMYGVRDCEEFLRAIT
jgi:hypothetical protein